MASHFKQFLIWATVSAISDGIGFARWWWRGSTCIKNIRVGALAFIAISNSSVKMEFGVTESCIMTSIVVNIQCHIVKVFYVCGVLSYYVFYSIFVVPSSTGTMQQWWQPGTWLLPPRSEWRRLIWIRKNKHLVLKYLLVVSQVLICKWLRPFKRLVITIGGFHKLSQIFPMSSQHCSIFSHSHI